MSEPTLPTPEQIRHAAKRAERYSRLSASQIEESIQPAVVIRRLCQLCRIDAAGDHRNPAQRLADRLSIDHETAVAIYLAYAPELYLASPGGQS